MRTPFARLVGLSFGLLLIGLSIGCANKLPPNLNPQATRAWYSHQVVNGLDVIRDAAIAANAVQPPVVSTEDARAIVKWHESAVKVIRDVPTGWQPAVLTGLDEALRRVSTSMRYTLEPYVALARALIERSRS